MKQLFIIALLSCSVNVQAVVVVAHPVAVTPHIVIPAAKPLVITPKPIVQVPIQRPIFTTPIIIPPTHTCGNKKDCKND